MEMIHDPPLRKEKESGQDPKHQKEKEIPREKENPKEKENPDHLAKAKAKEKEIPREKENVRNRLVQHLLHQVIGANGTSKEFVTKAGHANGYMARNLIATDQQSHEIEITNLKQNPKPEQKPKLDAHDLLASWQVQQR